MSGIGFSELIILFLIGLIVLGPERLPRVANQIGTWLGQARRMTRVMKRQLEEELDLENAPTIKPPSGAVKKPFSKTASATTSDAPGDNESASPHDDDTYSPAHEADSVGTGVSDDATDDEDDEDNVDDVQDDPEDTKPAKAEKEGAA